MKYAFIIGSNAFVVPSGVISVTDGEHSKEILRVKSIYHDTEPGSHLAIDLDIDDMMGNHIKLINNVPQEGTTLRIEKERDFIRILKADGNMVINVRQMDEESAMALEHNIVAELEVNMPVAVIRVFGDFISEGIHISAENEKLFINKNGYATSALAGDNHVRITPQGVTL